MTFYKVFRKNTRVSRGSQRHSDATQLLKEKIRTFGINQGFKVSAFRAKHCELELKARLMLGLRSNKRCLIGFARNASWQRKLASVSQGCGSQRLSGRPDTSTFFTSQESENAMKVCELLCEYFESDRESLMSSPLPTSLPEEVFVKFDVSAWCKNEYERTHLPKDPANWDMVLIEPIENSTAALNKESFTAAAEKSDRLAELPEDLPQKDLSKKDIPLSAESQLATNTTLIAPTIPKNAPTTSPKECPLNVQKKKTCCKV